MPRCCTVPHRICGHLRVNCATRPRRAYLSCDGIRRLRRKVFHGLRFSRPPLVLRAPFHLHRRIRAQCRAIPKQNGDDRSRHRTDVVVRPAERGSRRTRLSIRHSRSRPRRPRRLPAVQHPGIRHRLSRHAADRRNRSPHQLPTLPGRDRLHPAGLRPTGLPLCAEGRFHRRGCPVLLGRPSSCRRRRSSPHRGDRRRRGPRCRARRTCFRRRTRGVDDLR